MLNWVIRCSTIGGVTGHRESVVRINGEPISFVTESEALHEAVRLNMKAAQAAHLGPAIIKYWQEQADVARREGYV